MEKTKMDKVRRLLGNRYGEEGRLAIMKILGNALGMVGAELASCEIPTGIKDMDDGSEISLEELQLAFNGLTDLITRANKEPKVVEVPDENTEE